MKISLKLMSLIALLLIAAFIAGCATDGVTGAQEATAHYKMGLNRMSSGNDEAALYEFNTAISKDPPIDKPTWYTGEAYNS